MKDLGLLVMTMLVAATCCNGSLFHLQKVSSPDDVETIEARDRARISHFIASFPGAGMFTFGGMYYTRISVGSPRKEYTVVVDTGSDFLWISCKPCIGCPLQTDPGFQRSFFDVANSTTATRPSCRNSPCSYTVGYLGGSTTLGYLVTDLLHLPSATNSSDVLSVRVTFGCSTVQTGLLSDPYIAVDGILGLGPGDHSVLTQLQAQQIAPHVFSHCLAGDVGGGGFLVLGQVVDDNITYSPLIPSQPKYNLDLQSITVGGQILPVHSEPMNGNTGIVVDSGTSLTYLPQAVYDSFIAAVNNNISQLAQPQMSGHLLCYVPTSSATIIFPSPILTFAGGAKMTLRPKDYLQNMTFSDGSIKWCMGIKPVFRDGFPILGEISMKDKVIVYDTYQKRIGWADYDCRSSYNISTAYGFEKSQSVSKKGMSWVLVQVLFLVILW